MEIEPDVLFAYEMSGLSKLCTLLVEDEKVCERVINLNRKIKGKQINVLPLSYIEKQAAARKPKLTAVDDCWSLLNEDWVKIKPH